MEVKDEQGCGLSAVAPLHVIFFSYFFLISCQQSVKRGLVGPDLSKRRSPTGTSVPWTLRDSHTVPLGSPTLAVRFASSKLPM